ncbi:MAG: HesA/MoeB/ThiF family protein [bacterium]|nr:HesA/MoeB/ThiF family protein [bacterium]
MPENSNKPEDLFSRHYILPEIGRNGQAILLRSHVAIVGVGAVGSRIAEFLIRTGVGRLTLIDFDRVEFSNLSRQTLYTWEEAEKNVPKVEAARRHLNEIIPTCQVFPINEKITSENISSLLKSADIIADGTDNIGTRYLINDYCRQARKPWVYAGVVATKASVFPVLPDGACLRCAFPEPPPKSALPVAADAGILAASTSIAGARASTLILRILLHDKPEQFWETWDIWAGTVSRLSIADLKKAGGNQKCPLCDN